MFIYVRLLFLPVYVVDLLWSSLVLVYVRLITSSSAFLLFFFSFRIWTTRIGSASSMLTDDILLSIMERVDITTCVRTSVLSNRWKHLPWLLRELNIDVKRFLSVPSPNPIEVKQMDEAMASLTKAITSFLATSRSEATIKRLQLRLYLVNDYSDAIGPIVSQAIDTGSVEGLDLAIVDEKEPDDCRDEEMLQQARTVDSFFSGFSAWEIQAPDSKLSVLELSFCCLGELKVLCLPKLERLRWHTWISPKRPLSFDVVPSLKELSLVCGAIVDHRGFMLSEVLKDTTAVHNLTLNFQGERIWIKPEGKQLCTAFNKLRKLSLHGIFVEYDLLWTIVLLEAATSIEIFDIEIWEHPCILDTEGRRQTFGERTNPSWKVAEFKSCKEWPLKEFQITGFSPMEQQITLIRAIMQRASNLQTIILKDYQTCDYCEEIGALPRCERLPPERVFPKGKGEQDTAVEQLIRDMPDCNIQIIFGN
ncbi:hypothetical protein PVAP13_2NG576766 [Panicum virgatum]|uniref:F-box domain-containing protein n=1 Tax=Panicum virgatum TaxID=38727 RepID=A0A8T0VPL8_PANVG|nr:hypothetical protein PVAP13_2NG576766 [Panicum virgatum]